ncbi:PREDICTED: interferon-induced transmembrane protein 2 [Chinchilla lanigera]|uniref:interferon-induced transmembrane protein 2 n=1 Tax=Chinchilla lanigera TaxID=34839 RepID=UPI00038EF521|nr:PREDICTED: interferon-induced transmembrane protein 2 [Chinchilla lanigera]
MDGEKPMSGPARSIVINMPGENLTRDYVIWSLFNAIFINPCCLGIAAYAYSVMSRDRKMVGDVIGAQSYASTAKCLNVSALVLSIILSIVFIILYATVFTALNQRVY